MITREHKRRYFYHYLLILCCLTFCLSGCWTQVNKNGFGEINNSSAFSMIVFNNQLYVGTYNSECGQVWSYNGTSWDNKEFPGVDNHTNHTIRSMTIFNGCLYIGTGNSNGCEIWRTCDGTSWEIMVGDPQPGKNASGFGDKNNIIALSMNVFNGLLFVGTMNLSSVYMTTGCEMWCSSDGTSWEQANEDDFYDPDNPNVKNYTVDCVSLVVFNNYLYVGTENIDEPSLIFKNAQIWRIDAIGDPPFVWEKVTPDEFCVPNKFYISSMSIFNDYLYAATGDLESCFEICRTDAIGDPPFVWEKVTPDCGEPTTNSTGDSMVEFDDYLYIGTGNHPLSSTTSCEVWRTRAEGTPHDCQQVNIDRFGDANNLSILSMVIFNNHLYAGTGNYDGCEVWRYELVR